MLIFNAPFELVGWVNIFHSKLFIALDTLITSLTMAMVMFINLVISHGLSASNEMSVSAFYLPKLVVCILVFFSIWIWQYADKLNYLAYFENEFEQDEGTRQNEWEKFTLNIFLMLFYWAMALYYSYKALTVPPSEKNAKKRFSQYASGIVLIVSGVSTAVVVFPSESQIL